MIGTHSFYETLLNIIILVAYRASRQSGRRNSRQTSLNLDARRQHPRQSMVMLVNPANRINVLLDSARNAGESANSKMWKSK